MVAWLPVLLFTYSTTYRGHFLPLNLIFSYLWLTAFVLSAVTYPQRTFTGYRLPHTIEAFDFIAL